MKINIRIISLQLFLYIGIISCTNNTNGVFSPKETIVLSNPRVISLIDYDIENPLSVKISENKIIILNDDTENQINIISDTSIYKIGNIGRGPGEFLQISSLDPYYKEDSLCVGVYDFGKKEYTYINTNNRDNLVEFIWANDVNIDLVGRINDNIYVGALVFDSTNICLFNNKGDIIDRYTSFPTKPENIPLLSHSMACTGALYIVPNKASFARSVFFDGGIDFYSIKDNRIVKEWGFSSFDMDYDIDKNNNNTPIPNNETRRGYTSLSISNDLIYALFDGKPFLEDPNGQAKNIHVFDFQGNHIREYVLSNNVFDISVDLKNKQIYCLSINDNQEIDLLVYPI